jgi:hypothetical protein
MNIFLVAVAALIALNSFLHGYTDGQSVLVSPIALIAIAGLTAICFEKIMQQRAK